MLPLRNLLRCNITRTISRESRRYVKDPGIRRRTAALDLTPDEIETMEIDDFESDFMDVHNSHREHLNETRARKEHEKYFTIAQKYFKEKQPNFLTWHDKEQIRYLYRTNPDEWTIQQLSESFPALPHVIARIVKSNWTVNKPERIANHDRAVQKNWELFKQNQFNDLPKDLIEHLKKFTDRSLNFQPFQIPNDTKQKIELKTTRVKPEFSEIITSYEKLKNRKNHENRERLQENPQQPPPIGDTYLTATIKKSPPITLNRLQENLKNRVASGGNVDIDDRLIIENMKSKENSKIVETTETIDLTLPKYQNSSTSNYVKTTKDMKYLQYPDKIKIPKNLVKRGNIYKLNDCYYDYDGMFLYRVPGMG